MMHRFQRDGLSLSYRDEGKGPVLIFQHGLGASAEQPFEIAGGYDDFRRITLECRGHGGSELGPTDRLSIATFTDDLLALIDHLGIARVHVAGISMGAAIATRLAVLNPSRVQSLCVARPAWFDSSAPENMAIFAVAADCLKASGVDEARDRFASSQAFARLQAASPDNAASVLGQFDRPDPISTQALLASLAADGPGLSFADYQALRLAVQVLGHDLDVVHPLAMAKEVCAAIPGAKLVTITPKSTDKEAYKADFSAALKSFLTAVETSERSGPASLQRPAYG